MRWNIAVFAASLALAAAASAAREPDLAPIRAAVERAAQAGPAQTDAPDVEQLRERAGDLLGAFLTDGPDRVFALCKQWGGELPPGLREKAIGMFGGLPTEQQPPNLHAATAEELARWGLRDAKALRAIRAESIAITDLGDLTNPFGDAAGRLTPVGRALRESVGFPAGEGMTRFTWQAPSPKGQPPATHRVAMLECIATDDEGEKAVYAVGFMHTETAGWFPLFLKVTHPGNMPAR